MFRSYLKDTATQAHELLVIVKFEVEYWPAISKRVTSLRVPNVSVRTSEVSESHN